MFDKRVEDQRDVAGMQTFAEIQSILGDFFKRGARPEVIAIGFQTDGLNITRLQRPLWKNRRTMHMLHSALLEHGWYSIIGDACILLTRNQSAFNASCKIMAKTDAYAMNMQTPYGEALAHHAIQSPYFPFASILVGNGAPLTLYAQTMLFELTEHPIQDMDIEYYLRNPDSLDASKIHVIEEDPSLN